ncbi:hypothetical protein, partial [Rhabdaerophilum sp.]|uniref:hypothetical protein n=1 Tax=Rhabdaerophilum sp. TaxID=2717341 RepID=UPI0038D462CD
TKVAQPLQPFVDIEKSRLASHRPSSPTVIGAIESETGRSGEVFRTVQLPKRSSNHILPMGGNPHQPFMRLQPRLNGKRSDVIRAQTDLIESDLALTLLVFASAFSANRYPLGGRML